MSLKRFTWFAFMFLLTLSVVASPVLTVDGQAATNSAAVQSEQMDQPSIYYDYFMEASKEFGVPKEILLAVGYAETRWQDHKGEPSQLNGYGIMHLAENPTNKSLKKASQLLKVSQKQLKTDVRQNIRGGAAVLAEIAKEQNGGKKPEKLEDWYTAVAVYSGLSDKLTAKWHADEVYKIINEGAYREVDGKDIFLNPVSVTPNRGEYEHVGNVSTFATPDYPNARWVAAHSSNYTAASRSSINYVIVHTTQGSYSGAISWFQNSSANVSAHYVLRSSDGQVTQMVQNKDIAWHAGNWTYNQQSIGLEHEGYVSDPKWYTDSMYRSSANLTRWLCDRYGIPKTRTRIIGHNEVPGATHSDPGVHWDWNYYMSLINGSSGGGGGGTTEIVVDNTTSGRFSASANWDGSTYSSQKYGTNYRFATPQAVSDAAWYKANVPATGTYDVYAWWPANSGYNDATPYVIKTTTGNKTVTVNQRVNGGKWNHLGTFSIAGGDDYVVGVSRWSTGSGYVIADAVKLVKR
ncbi:N-acetylmuramoyl-L-alanine amidase [Hazenella coriacea]|uniref:N-acetylmuramoyl-L-alanine amidase n=1 Tax=Hazenella coriacea TaxID=1179467 RepID=A0A4R3L576_9BACL|nr:N-acetylmuramoyl-L-alanine amidase [Hazenella coriacea]TCS92185.1 transglycosylase-like protein with SLT domain [Hazenella coriacea]